MDTDQAYGKMAEANEIIENLPPRRYGIYVLLFLAEIAACFGVLYAI